MTINFYKNILSIFFFASVLALLSACSSGSSGGGGGGGASCNKNTHFCDTTKAARADCVSATHNCLTGALLSGGGGGRVPTTCDPALNFCDTPEKIVRATCNTNTHDCDTGLRTCDPTLNFCHTTDQALIADCDNITHDCATGNPRPIYAVPEPESAIGNYQPSIYEAPPTGGWATALTAARSDEYNNDGGGANRIGAAYAHARGYNGAGIIISNMGDHIDRDHPEFMGQLIDGYQAGTSDSGSNAGTCQGSVVSGIGRCSISTDSTSIAGIIAARQNGLTAGDGRQGIAYGAQIKPIDLFDSTTSAHVVGDKLKAAIEQASGTEIAVLNYEFTDNNTDTFTDTDGEDYAFNTIYQISTILPKERAAWIEAVKTTVVVVPHGDQGHNNANGILRRIAKKAGVAGTRDIAWAFVSAHDDDDTNDNINIGTAHGRLPKEVTELKGKWLTVITLKANNEIWEDGNGCGDAMAWCLGALGVGIDSTNHTDSRANSVKDYIEGESGSEFAAAHVTGAVAVVASSLPAVADTDAARAQRVKDLVAIILGTADDLGDPGVDAVYGHGKLNLARATQPIGGLDIVAPSGTSLSADASLDNSGITLPTSFGGALDGFTVGFIDDYKRAYIGNPSRITRTNAAFTLGDTIATWESPELKNIQLDSNSKMQFTNYDESADAKDTLIFTHHLPNHTIGFSYNEESKTPDLSLTDTGNELHFQKIRPIASDLMQLHATHKLGKNLTVKNALTSGEFDTGNRFNEAMTNLNYAGESRNLTIGAGTLKEYGQFLGASGTGAYQLSDATQSQVTHLAVTQNLPRNSAIKLKYTGFKTEVDMRYSNFANINDLTADEYQISLTKNKILGKNDSLNIELIQPFAITDGTLQQNTVLGYNAEGDYNNVTQNYSLAPTNRRQQIRMTWQNQINLERKNKTLHLNAI